MKATGPHRKLQLLSTTNTPNHGVPQSTINLVGNPGTAVATIDLVDDNRSKSPHGMSNASAKYKTNVNLPQLGMGQQTPTATTTIGTGRNNNQPAQDVNKTPSKSNNAASGQVQSPRGMNNQTNTNTGSQMRQSVSSKQLHQHVATPASNLTPVGSAVKSFQPVLKKEKSETVVQQSSMTLGGSNIHTVNLKERTPTNLQKRNPTESFTHKLAERVSMKVAASSKSGSKGVAIKDRPFNYEERQQQQMPFSHSNTQKSADHVQKKTNIEEDNLKDVAKSLAGQYEQETKTQSATNLVQQIQSIVPLVSSKTSSSQQVGVDQGSLPSSIKHKNNQVISKATTPPDVQINMVENFTKDELQLTVEERDEVRLRPSDNVSINYDHQLLMALGSGFNHSRVGSGQFWNQGGMKPNNGGLETINSSTYRAFIEENKSEAKIDYLHVGGQGNHDDVKFEVIREDLKDSFYSPRLGDQRDNSDFKRFNAEDDFQSQMMDSRWLQRMAAGGAISGFGANAPTEQTSNMQSVKDLQSVLKTPEPVNNSSKQQMLDTDQPNLQSVQIHNDNANDRGLEETPQNFKDRVKQYEEATKQTNLIQQQQQQAILTSLNFASPTAEGGSNGHQQPTSDNNINPISQMPNQAHVLSFSEDNPHYIQDAAFYNRNNNMLLNSFQLDESRAQSQLFLPQQQHQQQQANNKQEMAAVQEGNQSANTIIEMEKNYVIMQYETLLQQLSSEFQRVLMKTKETDEHLAKQEVLIQTQTKVIQDKEAQQFQQDQLNQQLQMQVQELLQELEQLTVEKTKRQQAESQNEAQAAEKEMLESTVQNLQSKVKLWESQDLMNKNQIESLQAKLRAYEGRLKQKEEEVFALQRSSAAQERDLQNLKESENNLLLEVQRAAQARVSFEESIQEMRQRALADQMVLRVRDNELDNVVRDYKAVKGSLDAIQMSYSQVMRENDQLKALLNEHERTNIQMKSLFQTREAQIGQLKSDAQRLTAIIEKERQRSAKVEEDYRRKIDQMQQELMVAQRTEERIQQHHAQQRSYDNRVKFNDEQPLMGTQRFVEPNSCNGSYGTPRKEEAAKMLWMYQKPPTADPQNSVVPSAYHNPQILQPSSNNQDQMQLRRGTNAIINQNQSSQLHELFSSWEQQPPAATAGYKSVERPQTSQRANLFGGVSRQDPQRQSQQQQASNLYEAMAQQNFSPRVPNARNPLGSHSFDNNEYDTHLPQQAQAAGKKSITDISPFSVTQESTKQQIGTLQNTLSSMQIDKERLENEYRKLGTSKNKQQIEKKKELEFEIEVIDKNLHQVKQKLRELNAL